MCSSRLAAWWRWLRDKARGRPRPRTSWQVILYTRQGCHLCDGAWQLLEQARRRHGFHLETRDVDTDPELVRQHGLHVPVVEVNGRVRFRGIVNPVLLRRLFEANERTASQL